MVPVSFYSDNIYFLKKSKQMTGEKIPGDLDTWDYFGTDPNAILVWSYAILSQRATTLYHTHPPVTSAINKLTNYAIGSGLRFRSQPDWEILGWTKDKAKSWGMQFQKLVHYVFLLLNFYQKQGILFRTGLIMGDSLLLFDRNKNKNNNLFDIIETGGDQIDWKCTGEKCTLGIWHDEYLRREAVQLFGRDKKIEFQDGETGDQNIIQFYDKLIARQLRGYPLAYRIISAAKNNDRWWDATLARLVMETIIFAQVSETNAGDTQRVIDTIADTLYANQEIDQKEGTIKRENIANGAPGAIISRTEKGKGIEYTELKTPSNNFDKVENAYIDMVGMATDVPPECVLSRYNTSYTAHKGAFNDFQKSYILKRNNFAHNVADVVLYEVAKYIFLEGMIEMPKNFFDNPIIRLAALKGNWLGPVPGHINPVQEVDALIKAKDNAFVTPADATLNYSMNEWDDQIEEWQQQMAEWRKIPQEKQAEIIGNEMQSNEDTYQQPVEVQQ